MKKFLLILILFLYPLSLSATTWYARPTGGSYGNEDGTTYADAWDGLLNVVWGGAGVVAGDTLYVCGLNVHEATTINGISGQADITPVSGSAGNVITIRGDYGGDAGIIWGAYLWSISSWTDNGNNVWYISVAISADLDYVFEDILAESWTILDKETSVGDVENNTGSFYADNGNSRIYVHCSDSGDPTGRIHFDQAGYDFQLNGLSYIKFQDIDFYCHPTFGWEETYDNITWDGCKIIYNRSNLIVVTDGCDYITVNDCELAWADNGIYNISAGNNAPSYYTYSNNTIHDIGVRASNQNSDSHAIGIQGGHDGLIEGNYCYNCGNTILLYAYTNQELKDTIIRKNFVKDAHSLAGADGWAISTQCNNDSLSDKTGNQFYHNIMTNCAVGMRLQFEDEQVVYNNVFHNCAVGVLSERNYNGTGPNIIIKNNIFLTNSTYHIDWHTGASTFVINADYNQFHDGAASPFRYGSTAQSVATWQSNSKAGSTFDPNSQAGDPLFVNAGGSYDLDADFQIPTGSPCKDAGTNVGLGTDYAGLTLPSGSDYDIGAYEFDQGEAGAHKTVLKSGVILLLKSGVKKIIKDN